MAIFLLRVLLFLIPAVFIVRQVVMPILRNDPVFPAFRAKPQLVKNAEESLLEAQAAKKAAEMELEAARIQKEARQINEETYKKEL